MKQKQTDKTLFAGWLLRAALAVVFIYAAVGSLLHPDIWLGYLPAFLQRMSNAHGLLKVFAVYEIVLALWILSGRWLRSAALLAAATLAGIVLAQPGDLIISFRDIGLALAALALAALA